MSKPGPLVCNLEPGKHAICNCGLTENAPYCDGKHEGTDGRPVIEDVETNAKNIAWCTCHASEQKPHCDGSHRQFWDNPEQPPQKPESE